MQTNDISFFEEYKHLDKLCGDMYSCQNGISAYIAHMEDEELKGSRYVSSWSSDYKALMHIRRVRNRIAHNTEPYQMSEPEDLAFVLDYYERILSGRDSLALLRKAVEKERKHKPRQKREQTYPDKAQPVMSSSMQKDKKLSVRDLILIVLGIAAFVLLLILVSRFFPF